MIKLREMIIYIATSRNSLLQICASLCLQRPNEETRETMGAREIDRESERETEEERERKHPVANDAHALSIYL